MSLYQDTPLEVGPFTLTVSDSEAGDNISYTVAFDRITLAQAQGVKRACSLDLTLGPTEYVALRRDFETAKVFAFFGDSQALSELVEGNSPSTLTGWTAGGTTVYGDPIYLRCFVQLISGFTCLGVNGSPVYPDPEIDPFDTAQFEVRDAVTLDHPDLVNDLPRNCEQVARCVGSPFAAIGYFGSASLKWSFGLRYFPITVTASGGTFNGTIGTPVPDWPQWIGTIYYAANTVVKYLSVNYRALIAVPATESGESNDPPTSDPRWEAFTVTDHIEITKYPNGIKIGFVGMFLGLKGFNGIEVVSQNFTQAPASSNYNSVSVEVEAVAFGSAGGLLDPPSTYSSNCFSTITVGGTSGSYTNPDDFSFSYSDDGLVATFGVTPP